MGRKDDHLGTGLPWVPSKAELGDKGGCELVMMGTIEVISASDFDESKQCLPHKLGQSAFVEIVKSFRKQVGFHVNEISVFCAGQARRLLLCSETASSAKCEGTLHTTKNYPTEGWSCAHLCLVP